VYCCLCFFFFFQAEDGIRDFHVTGVQTCALPILWGYPRQASHALLARVGLQGGLADVALWSGALLDALLGIAMLVLPGRRPVYYAQLLLMAGYTVLISLWLPEFWLHPFGPLLKNIPIAGAILALILLDRAHGPGDR